MKNLSFILFISFCTVAQAQYKTEIYVAKDGSGEFTRIQEAIDETKSFPDQPITIYIKNGIYEEKVIVPSWNPHLRLQGESPDGVIIRWNDYFDKIDRGRNSTFLTATLLIQADDFQAANLRIENTAGERGQAIALAVEADRSVFTNCSLIGHQDVLYADGAHSRQLYKNCYIEGTTDFIFGGATALFQDCTIHSKSNSYITAASTPAGREYGFVFLDCQLTAASDVNGVFLGRPWRSYAKTVFIRCQLGPHIKAEGWHNWNSPEKEQTVFYAEYNNSGAGASTDQRVNWSHTLNRRQAKKYRPDRILQAFRLPEMKRI